MKLNYRRTFFVGFAFLSICAFWQLYDTIIPLILSKTFGMGETVTGGVMALDNVLALFLIPFFGTLSDKVHTKLGKRTPFILAGTILAVIFMTLIPLSNNRHNFMLFFVSLGFLLLAMGSYRAPAVALMPDLTPKPLRSKANSIINLMGAVGAIITLLLIKTLIKEEENPDYTLVFAIVAGFMLIAVIILLKTIHENEISREMEALYAKEEGGSPEDTTRESSSLAEDGTLAQDDGKGLPKDVKRSLYFIFASIFLWFTAYNAVTTAFSRYAVKIWHMEGGSFANPLLIATCVAILSYIPIGIISSLIGRKKTIIIGIIMMTVSYFAGFIFTSYSPLVNIAFAIIGIGWSAISVNSYPMVVEMGRGSDTGKYTSLYYMFSMTAQIITPTLSGFLLERVSYRTLFPYAFFFSLLSLCTMLFVKHGDSKPPKKKSALENFDVDD